MELNKAELNGLMQMVSESVSAESNLYGDLEIYKKSESYKAKSDLYAKLASEYHGNTFRVDEDSIFGLLDLK